MKNIQQLLELQAIDKRLFDLERETQQLPTDAEQQKDQIRDRSLRLRRRAQDSIHYNAIDANSCERPKPITPHYKIVKTSNEYDAPQLEVEELRSLIATHESQLLTATQALDEARAGTREIKKHRLNLQTHYVRSLQLLSCVGRAI